VAEHVKIVEAIEDGDGAAARAAVELNWQNAAKRLASAIAARGDGGAWPTPGQDGDG
jgi:DNA-binding GntR family transcriptional regulator